MSTTLADNWSNAEHYHRYVGRWSAIVAPEFIDWLDAPVASDWLDVGCGAGDITRTILDRTEPASVRGIDLAPAYVDFARQRIPDKRVSFSVGDAANLAAVPDNAFDAVVSGLVLNFVPEHTSAVRSMTRVARPGGIVAAYVWDYAGEMQFMRYFWDAAVELFPEAAPLDEADRFPMCNPEGLTRLWDDAGLQSVETRSIDIPTIFADFDDFWQPFLGGQGSAPTFAISLTEADRTALMNLISSRLPFHSDGSIHLIARAWAIGGGVAG